MSCDIHIYRIDKNNNKEKRVPTLVVNTLELWAAGPIQLRSHQ
jgi:hypothetical protein